ncbi:MAG: dodecin family protein [Thermoplasmatota archaeon]
MPRTSMMGTETMSKVGTRGNGSMRHEHRTAKVVELIGGSRKSFDDAILAAIKDASESTRGISGAEVCNMTVKCENGKVVEYKVALKVAFGIERTKGV